ncbi:glycine cleavage system protein GcvH [Tessaracoccus sp. OH4464_COT-324]|uniref:glycine cleavage system protein GcvH n=1 Tax=Tessaracoccus sp. OH4464_COT-324 TaxID=2491059 RepID=UPI000F643B9A|nr:glycine cleavage system protein GcvH [Tessaracoccus sp. OH4464_COT-324]RRD47693.1 glycine cleavage system protein GcvH [Tessaracoccus sp. OH4464_COT-324]
MVKYTEDHEWLDLEGDVATVGITAHAAEQLGDIVFIELPEVDREVAEGDEIVVIESVKAASDITAPLAGTIVEVNEALVNDPSLVNADARKNWFFRLRLLDVTAFDDLLDEDAYRALIG